MTTQNKSVRDGFLTVTDGLLEYRTAISKKLALLTGSEEDEGLRALFIGWNEGIDEILESIVKTGNIVGKLETIFIEFGVYQTDGKED